MRPPKEPKQPPKIAAEISHLTFTPLKRLDDAIQVEVYVGEECKHISEYNNGEDGPYSWILSSASAVPIKISSKLYYAELVVNFTRYNGSAKATKRTSLKTEIQLKDTLIGITSCTIKLEDGAIMGTLDLKLNVITPEINTNLLDIARQTRIPILEYTRHTLEVLPSIEKLAGEQYRPFYNIIAAVYISLWKLWRSELPALIQKHSVKSVHRNDLVVASIMAARDNALEDTMLQLHWQLELALQCFNHTAMDASYYNKLLRVFFETAAESAVVVYQWADVYRTSTWDGFATIAYDDTPGEEGKREKFDLAVRDLDRLHQQFLLLCFEMQQMRGGLTLPALPRMKKEFLRSLYEGALQETRDQVNRGPYTSTFECILGPATEVVFQWMEKDFESSSESAEVRDILRRLMTHLAQRSCRLPRSMMLDNIRYFQNSNDAPRPIAGGSFADVYKGIRIVKKNREYVAIKRLRLLHGEDAMPKRIRHMYLEVLTSHTLKHPNILAITGISRDVRSLSVITPWLDNGTVHDYLEKISVNYLSPPEWLLNRWINHIAQGLTYLHGEGMAHGDIRGVNILVDDDEVARIADFGLAVFVNGHSRNYGSTRSGNVEWFAPEMLRPAKGLTSRPTKAADVYSFSHVCIELYSSSSPYPELNEDVEIALGSFIDAVVDPVNPRRPSRPRLMPDMLWELLQRYWCGDPTVRATAAEVARDVSMLNQQATPDK